jgi:ankyrin repeat protein
MGMKSMKRLHNDKAFDTAIKSQNTEEFKQLLQKFESPVYLPSTLAQDNLKEMTSAWLEYISGDKKAIRSINEFTYTAIFSGNVNLVKMAFDYGADIDYQHGVLLRMACMHGNLDIVKLLLEKGGKIHAENEFGETGLMLAIMNNRKEIISYLIEHGADLNYRSKTNKSIITQMSLYRQKDMMTWFLTHYSNLFTEENRKELQKSRLNLLF